MDYFKDWKFYIINAKIPNDKFEKLKDQIIHHHGKIVDKTENADLILTALQSLSRIFHTTPLHPKFNNELIELLEELEKIRKLNDEQSSALAYRRAIAALKAYPRELESYQEELEQK
ncbi:hypothetical protein Glove_261g67 [Diversispora epigaea]|uniref:Uncharacterized protein n=1 Tax=Diversispora epigaea TaxID=1348612 RepID=A0A397ICV5_9GLOM|nr:hypothetical protein Glove_261g67 [Diversispora epigaea]